jgi:hypothetical protein
VTLAALSASSASASAAFSMLRHKLEADWTLAGIGITFAATPESRSVFVAIIVPEFEENSKMTFDIFTASSR